MAFRSSDAARSGISRALLVLSLVLATGCQAPQPGLSNRLAAHVALVDLSDLAPDTELANLKVRAAIPRGWEPMTSSSTALYEHEQWRSPSRMTGVGVALIHMPFPMSAKALVWLAKTQYSRQNAADHKPDPKVMGEWTDSVGREWFEGENEKYHVKGYVVTSGMQAWAVYSGYRIRSAPRPEEINAAFRSMDSIVPLPFAKKQDDLLTQGVQLSARVP
jgi:hypothetical protein